MARVGITGASGFIGGALVPALARRGDELVLVDDRSGPIRVEYPGYPVVVADFSGDIGLAALVDCDVILHLGAVSGVMTCARDPRGTARTNVEGTRALVEKCIERRIPIAFASSFAVVGTPERLPVTETTPPHPTHEYARQKAEGELIIERMADRGTAPTAVLRMSNVYGTYEADGRIVSKGNVVTQFTHQAAEGRIIVNAPGTQKRDFIHIEDVVSHWVAVSSWLKNSPSITPSTRIFNVASGESLGILELAEKVRSVYARLHPESRPVLIDMVKNPREGIELIDPQFAVSRAVTERVLQVHCSHSVDQTLEYVLSRDDAQ